MPRPGLAMTVLLGMAALSSFAANAPVQRVSLVAAGAGQVQLRYAFEGVSRVAGLGVRVHYDPACVRVLRVLDVEKSGLVGLDATPQVDTDDADGDPRTTHFLQAAWLDLRGAWLASRRAGHTLLSIDIERRSCARGASDMRISGTGTAPGVRLETLPLRLEGVVAR